jgi:hypothetical protein
LSCYQLIGIALGVGHLDFLPLTRLVTELQTKADLKPLNRIWIPLGLIWDPAEDIYKLAIEVTARMIVPSMV